MDQPAYGFAEDVVAPVRALVALWSREPWDDDSFPASRIDNLKATGAWRHFASPGARSDALLETLRLIGRADLSLGRLFEGHVNACQLVTAYGDAAQRNALDRTLAVGALLGVWNTEPTPGLRLVRVGEDRWRLDGAKIFATGAGRLDHALVSARDEQDRRQLVLVALGDEAARADNDGWRVRGMRGTLSGRFDFSGLVVDRDALIGEPGDYEREPRFSAGAWRFCAVQLGAVEALVRHLREHLVATGKDEDPIHRARFAQCVCAARSAGEWVRRAAALAEAEAESAIAFVLMTRGIVEDAGLVVMEAAARSAGTTGFFAGHPIDRVTRDLGLYLRQPVPDQARDRAAAAWLEADCWGEDSWW